MNERASAFGPPGSTCRRFAGRTAVVTGATSGIGHATAVRLATEGAVVLGLGRSDARGKDFERAVEEAGSIAHFHPLDLTDANSIRTATAWVKDQVGELHVLINSAGVVHIDGKQENPFLRSGMAGWDTLVDVNLRGCAHLTHELFSHMTGAGAAIVNVASEGAFKARDSRWIYDLTKAALLSFTRSVAAAGAPHGIRANAVAPGGTLTEMHLSHGPVADIQARQLPQTASQCLLRRWAEPHEIASAITFLASDDASYITGTTLAVDGGGAGMS